jgi:hypothetical protein
MDVSPVAIRLLKELDEKEGMSKNANNEASLGQLSGRLDYVNANFMDTEICPGPYDVVIERRTVQLLPDAVRARALAALAARLNKPGILYSHCNDSNYGAGKKLFHASEQWFRAEGWLIWDGVPELPLAGRTAWLVHSAS